MKSRRILGLVVAGLIGAAGWMGGADAAAAKELRLATIAPPKHVWLKVADRIAKELAKRPELDLSIKIFPAGQLGQEAETLQQIESGILDMSMFTLAALVTREPALNGWYTPYLFPDVATAGKAAALPAAQEMLANLQSSGMIGLGYTLAGMRHILAREGEVRSASDVARKKVRITPFDAARVWWEAMGAIPTPTVASAVYQALQNGLIDLVEVDMDLMQAFSLYEPAASMTLTGHMVFPGAVTISKTVWDRLTPEQQQGLRKVVDVATQYGFEEQAAAEVSNLELMRAKLKKVVTLENGEQAFAAANKAFQQKFGDIPLVAAFQEQARQLRGK